jgi:hypothetical protein
VEGGYNFVLLDGDVYLTNTHHPLAAMLPLNDSTWDIQFQSDRSGAQDSQVNIGWYWARPTPVIAEFFNRSRSYWNTHPTEWDQEIMNWVRRDMISEGKLDYPKSVVLNVTAYKSTMLFDWPDIYVNESKIDEMNAEGTMVHYTMIFNATKVLVAKQFGHWLDKTYYTQRRKIIQPVGIRGTSDEILDQISLTVYLAKVTGRTFMWPTAVNHTCLGYEGGWKLRPPLIIADVQNVDENVSWVEGSFFRNRRRYTADHDLKVSRIALRDLKGPLLSSGIRMCRSRADVLVIDFNEIEEGWRSSFELDWNSTVKELGIGQCRDCWEMAAFSTWAHVVC